MTTSGSGEIRKLDAQTVERIAAGEVVERPASAVKELVENSIDAGATRVSVTVEGGGTELIRVTDDGHGMTEEALRKAVQKHTTSKIRDIDDLERGVGTLGFRGEALHAIGAVSRLTITSRPQDGDHGTEVTVEGGEITGVSPAGCPDGTTVEVRDLFYNVPARRKYLKQESTEFAHVNTVVTNYALAKPDVAVSLEHGDRETFATNGTGDLREAILSVYGHEVAQSMIAVEYSSDDLPAGPLEQITGLVSHPETNRASPEYLSTFVNERYVTASTVRDAVINAYGTQLAPDRYPFAVLFLELNPATVDVNVHPRKREIRFADNDGIREQVQTAIESSLLSAGLIRSSAPRGQSAPEQTEINPHRTVDERDVREDKTASTGERTAESSAQSDADTSRSGTTTETTETSTTESNDSESSVESSSQSGVSRPHQTAQDENRSSAQKFEDAGTQARLDGRETNQTVAFERLPSMRILGQLHDTYIVAETADGMVLIDQHAADERINYERLQESLAGETTTQTLATPVEIPVTAREADLFGANREALARLGFTATLVDERTVEVTTVPALIAETAGPAIIRDVLSDIVGGESIAKETVEATVNDLLADMACYPSITGNTSLKDGTVRELLATLDECENPYACPHGRPVVIEFANDEIDARFERDYPGHQ